MTAQLDHLSLPKRLLVSVSGPLYAALYFSVRHRFLGFTLAGWLKFFTLVLIVVAWLGRSGIGWVLAAVALAIAIRIVYWDAKRRGYLRFFPFTKQTAPQVSEPIADNKRVKVCATGTFSVSHKQAYLLQHPAEYWRVPLGDHAVMVEHEPGSFLYQFIEPAALLQIQSGILVHGLRPRPGLSLTFLSNWGPEFVETNLNQFLSSPSKSPEKLQRKMYLTFTNPEDKQAVWYNLLRDTGNANAPLK